MSHYFTRRGREERPERTYDAEAKSAMPLRRWPHPGAAHSEVFGSATGLPEQNPGVSASRGRDMLAQGEATSVEYERRALEHPFHWSRLTAQWDAQPRVPRFEDAAGFEYKDFKGEGNRDYGGDLHDLARAGGRELPGRGWDRSRGVQPIPELDHDYGWQG